MTTPSATAKYFRISAWILLSLLAIIVGLYPSLYFILGEKFGLLRSKPPALLSNTLWRIGFYAHIIPGGIALLTGWLQFSRRLRERKVQWHRQLGKVYVIAAIVSSLAGFCIGFTATGGPIAQTGFIGLAIVWFTTTLLAYTTVRQGNTTQHEQLMIYSYAACLAAVTLRLWLPLLVYELHYFIIAYRVVAWLCWVPNLFVAWLIVRRLPRNITYSSRITD
ncbi:DUF2306 domain-containing protein [Chitinophaga varians]|uniref:DUF2306 domain-containing protein n=1 Tax=Chitinophaga varians TaxID=2202339 RepID=UPI00165F67A9|nr:DUF2306 domain-containing protein [Chitinophaga varians]MBC9909078.1 DUF2306 domain-containing protein [Chitinophaga varians]